MASSPSTDLFQEYAGRRRIAIDQALDRYTQYGDDCPTQLRQAIRHSLLAAGGKRLRPLLVLMAAEVCGGSSPQALPAACAVEMVHTYSLIHDDLPAMDDDDWRRGQPSCHAKFGEATAILAGDALLTQAFEVLAGDVTPALVAARCCAELAQAAGASGMVGGQMDDLDGPEADRDVRQLERIHRRKTGAMFRVSLRLGGLIAETDQANLAALDAYSTQLGLAFQVVDDLLDVQGRSADLGKTTGKDAVQGKLTFPAVLGEDESRRRASLLVQQAKAALEPFGDHGRILQSLAEFVLERNR